MQRTHLLELLLLARRNVHLCAVLHVRRGEHRADAGAAAGHDRCARPPLSIGPSGARCEGEDSPTLPLTSNRLAAEKSARERGELARRRTGGRSVTCLRGSAPSCSKLRLSGVQLASRRRVCGVQSRGKAHRACDILYVTDRGIRSPGEYRARLGYPVGPASFMLQRTRPEVRVRRGALQAAFGFMHTGAQTEYGVLQVAGQEICCTESM